jgi:hypothetical protein
MKTLDMRSRISVSEGHAALLCDGEPVWYQSGHALRDCLSVRQAEAMARKTPFREWRIVLHGSRRGYTYQRKGHNRWVLIRRYERGQP